MERCPLCIIPARGGSRRLPRKNMALAAGKPLVAWAAESAVQSKVFDEIIVSSEDDEILSCAQGIDGVTACRCPAELATDTATVRAVCLHLLTEREAPGDTFAVLLAGNPLRTGSMIVDAWNAFRDSSADALMSVVPFVHPPQRALHLRGDYIEFHFEGNAIKRTQEFEQLYRHDGTVFFARTKTFLQHGQQYLPHTMAYVIPPSESADIDTQLDLEWAEFRMQRRRST